MPSRAEDWQLAESGPEAYERYLVPAIFAPFAERLVELAAPGPGLRVLDVACGTGIAARKAHARVGSAGTVVGVDSNSGMLDVARAASAALEPPIEWLAADAAAAPPLPDESVDCVLCQQGLQFFADREAALREMSRVLVPGGRVALSVWRALEANPGFALLVEALERHAGRDVAALMRAPFAAMDGDQLRALVAGAGLRDVRIHVRIEDVHFASAEEFLRREAAASPLAGPVAALGGGVREALARDLAELLRAHTGDRGVVFPMETRVATALRLLPLSLRASPGRGGVIRRTSSPNRIATQNLRLL